MSRNICELKVFCIELGAWWFGRMQKATPQLFPKSWKLKQEGSQNQLKVFQNESLWRISGFRVASRFQGPQKVSAPDTFWEPLDATGWIWGAIVTPLDFEGGPKIEFFYIESNKMMKRRVRERCHKKTWIWNGFSMPKWKVWHGKSDAFTPCLLQVKRFGRVTKFDEEWVSK